jgi:diaminohydroxyphosphoribosylaminopyrimidine deaminase/5-amino-6-(5-phosphoribosylamino)uracil reductase
MVGAGTARADDPRLDVRGLGDRPQPLRVVLSRRLALPPARALTDGTGGAVHMLHGALAPKAARAALVARGVTLHEVATDGSGQLDLNASLATLGGLGLTRVYCEGGGTLAAALLAAGLVDRLDCYVAGAAIGAEGIPALGAMGLSTLAEAPRMVSTEVRRIGSDVLNRWEAQDPGGS